MFNKKLKEKIECLENQVSTLIEISSNTIRFEDSQLELNKNFIKIEDGQSMINKKTLDALKSLNLHVQILTARVEILEKKLAESNTDESESLEDDLDRNGGTISDETGKE